MHIEADPGHRRPGDPSLECNSDAATPATRGAASRAVRRAALTIRAYLPGAAFICSPQQISECGMFGGHGHGFSYTRVAPHFSQVYRSPARRGIADSLAEDSSSVPTIAEWLPADEVAVKPG